MYIRLLIYTDALRYFTNEIGNILLTLVYIRILKLVIYIAQRFLSARNYRNKFTINYIE